jgi:hypothetical protein
VLDAGYLDVQRKLYLRELVARFSHHLAITWNLGEEHHHTEWAPYGQTVKDTKKMAEYLRKIDPYDQFIVVHTHSYEPVRNEYTQPYLGYEYLDGISIQCHDPHNSFKETLKWVKLSADSVKRWVMCLDEIGPAGKGALPDKYSMMHDTIRKAVLWGNLMAGGAGVEWYMGYKFPHNDLNCEDWRSRDNLWNITRYALEFFQQHLPFHEMTNMNKIVDAPDAHCLGKEGSVYAIYLPHGGTTGIKLPAGKSYRISWYNPREGGELIKGKTLKPTSSWVSVGTPPAGEEKDWACLVEVQ